MEKLWTRSFILLTLVMFFLFFGFYLLLPTLPLYFIQQGISELQVGAIIGAYTLAAVVARPLVGGLLDRYGRRRFIIMGLLFFAICMSLYNWVSGVFLLFLVRILHGFSWAFSTTSIGTAITDVIPAERRGEGMGWFGMATTLAMAIGPIIGVAIIQSYPFSTLFLFAVGLSIAALLLAILIRTSGHLPQQRNGKMELFDPSLLSISIVLFFASFPYGGITTFLPLFAESIQVNAGTFFLVYAISLSVTRPVAGKLADRYNEGVVIMPSLVVMIASLLVLSGAEQLVGVVISAILYGIGFGGALPALQAAMIRLVPATKRGLANATFFTALDLGIGLGAVLLGLVSQYGGYTWLFIVCAASGVFSLLLFMLYVKRLLQTHSGRPMEG